MAYFFSNFEFDYFRPPEVNLPSWRHLLHTTNYIVNSLFIIFVVGNAGIVVSMTDAKYERIHTEQDAHADQDENDFDFISGSGGGGGSRRSSIHIIENTLSYSGEKKLQTTPTIMQTPSAILALIFIYFGLSISLTFYQRSLLKVLYCLWWTSANNGQFIYQLDLFVGISFSTHCCAVPFNFETINVCRNTYVVQVFDGKITNTY